MTAVLLVNSDPRALRALRRALARDVARGGGGSRVIRGARTARRAVRVLDAEDVDLLVLGPTDDPVAILAHAARVRPHAMILGVGPQPDPIAFALAWMGARNYYPEASAVPRTLDELLADARRPAPLEPHVRRQVGHAPLAELLADAKRWLVDQARREAGVRGASRALGVARQTVQRTAGNPRSADHPRSERPSASRIVS